MINLPMWAIGLIASISVLGASLLGAIFSYLLFDV